MALSQRERWIAFAVGGVIALAGLDYFVISPYSTALADTRAENDAAVKTRGEQRTLVRKRKELLTVWADMRAGGMQSNFDLATQQAINAINAWAAESQLRLTSSYSDTPQEVRPTAAAGAPARPAGAAPKPGQQDLKFFQIAVHAQGEGSIAGVAKLLWRIETTKIPMRVNSITITPVTEGTDNLRVQLDVSTLCVQGELDTGRPRATTAPAADTKGVRL